MESVAEPGTLVILTALTASSLGFLMKKALLEVYTSYLTLFTRVLA